MIFEGYLDDAIDLLSIIYNRNDTIIKQNPSLGNNIDITETQAKAMRLGSILSNLFVSVALSNYWNHSTDKAYKYILKCDELFPNDVSALDRYVFLARISYEKGDMLASIKYSKMLSKISGGYLFAKLNFGFYAIINDDPVDFAKMYTSIWTYKGKVTFNPIDVIEFLERRMDDGIKCNVVLLKFAIIFFYYLYVDETSTRSQLIKFRNDYNFDEYQPVIKLCDKILTYKSKHRVWHGSKKRKKRR